MYDSAMVQYQKAVRDNPDFAWAWVYQAMCYEQLGMTGDMIRELETARRLYDHQFILARLAYGYALVGRRSDAEGIRAYLFTLAQQRYVAANRFALIELGLGNRGKALEWLEKSVVERSPTISYIFVDPTWDPLRSEPRFMALLDRMGLSQEANHESE